MCNGPDHAFNRGKVASLIAAALSSHGVRWAEARNWSADARSALAKELGQSHPSADTWDVACGMLSVAQRERVA